MSKLLPVSMLCTALLAFGTSARAEFIYATHQKPYPEIRVEANDVGQPTSGTAHDRYANAETNHLIGKTTGTPAKDSGETHRKPARRTGDRQ